MLYIIYKLFMQIICIFICTYRISFNLGRKLQIRKLYYSVQSLSHVWLFVTPWTAVCRASLSITNSQSFLKFMSIVSVMPSNYLIFCHPLLLPSIFPSIKVFPNESSLHSSGQSFGTSTLASVLPVNIKDWSPLGWTGWISLQSKRLSRVFSNTTVQKHQLFGTQFLYSPTLIPNMTTGKSMALTRQMFVGKVMSV